MKQFKAAAAWLRIFLALGALWFGTAGGCLAGPVPAGALTSSHAYFEYAVYYPTQPQGDIGKRFAEHLRVKGAPRLVRTPPASAPSDSIVLMRVEDDISKYPPPSLEFLRYFGRGLSQEQAAKLQTSARVAILDFAHPSGQALHALRSADALVEAFARQTGGLIWDEETREVFTPDAWKERRVQSWEGVLPNVQKHITIHAYKEASLVRAITLGMAKFGLPDLVIEEISWSDSRPMGNLLNAVVQAMVEGASPVVPGAFTLDLRSLKSERLRDEMIKSLRAKATAKAEVRLTSAQRKEGDPRNRLVEIGFDAYEGRDLHARQTKLLVSLFGVEPDSVYQVRHDAELERASRTARERLPELRATFNKGMQPGDFIQLKVPFATSGGGKEYMWVEVNSWSGGRITGLLKNQPAEVPSLQAGQTVEVREEEVFDYYLRRADGKTEGNETGKVIENRSGTQR